MRTAMLFMVMGAVACAGQEKKAPATSGSPEVAQPTEKVASEETVERGREVESKGRMTQAAIAALGIPEDSVCRGYFPEKELRLAPCEFHGPYQGEIQGDLSAQGTESLVDAMLACHADIRCTGVSADWYTGAKWFPVSDATPFEINDDSYGCSFVLSCP